MKFVNKIPVFSTIEKHYFIPPLVITIVVSWYSGWIYAIGTYGFVVATFIPLAISILALMALGP